MSWGKKQGSAAPSLAAAADLALAATALRGVHLASAPIAIELLAGALRARVYLHEVAARGGRVPCWSYVSEGLHAVGQDEIVCTLRRAPRDLEAFPAEPLALLVTLYQRALRGQRVLAGEHSEIVGERLFGCHVLYVDAHPLPGVALPARCLSALLITRDELDAVRRLGCARVLSRLGHATAHFPYPPWSERARASVAGPGVDAPSLVDQVGVRLIGDLTASAQHGCVTVEISRRWHRTCREALTQLPDVPLAFLTRPAPGADACLVWAPGARGPSALGRSAGARSRVSGSCVVAVGGQPANGARLIEDGFALELTAAAWAALRAALRDGRALTIRASADEMDFALRWREAP